MLRSKLDTEALRHRLLQAFREHEPSQRGGFVQAARQAACDFRTAKRAWAVGWPGLPPLRDVLAAERVEAAARLRRESLPARLEEAHEAAREDAVEARAAEGKLVRLAQVAVTNSLAAMHREAVFDYQRELWRMAKDSADPGSARAKAALRALKSIVEIESKLITAGGEAQRQERLVLGDATAIIGGEVGIQPVAPVDVTPEELQAEVEAAERALEELRALNAPAPDDNDPGVEHGR